MYKCIGPSSHLRKCLKDTGIFTKAQVVICSVTTHWHYAEISGVTVSVKRILSLGSKGVGSGRRKEQRCKNDVKWAKLVNSNENTT